MKALTKVQQRYLEEVRAAGVRTYTGRARKPLKALERAGLVTVHWDMVPQTKGSGIELVQRLTARPK